MSDQMDTEQSNGSSRADSFLPGPYEKTLAEWLEKRFDQRYWRYVGPVEETEIQVDGGGVMRVAAGAQLLSHPAAAQPLAPPTVVSSPGNGPATPLLAPTESIEQLAKTVTWLRNEVARVTEMHADRTRELISADQSLIERATQLQRARRRRREMRAERDEALFERDGARQECDRLTRLNEKTTAKFFQASINWQEARAELEQRTKVYAPTLVARVMRAALAWRDTIPAGSPVNAWADRANLELVKAVDAYRTQLDAPPVVSPAEMPAALAQEAQGDRTAPDAQEGTQTPENGSQAAEVAEGRRLRTVRIRTGNRYKVVYLHAINEGNEIDTPNGRMTPSEIIVYFDEGSWTELVAHGNAQPMARGRKVIAHWLPGDPTPPGWDGMLQLPDVARDLREARKSRDEHLGRLEAIRDLMVRAGYADESVEAVHIGSSVVELIHRMQGLER